MIRREELSQDIGATTFKVVSGGRRDLVRHTVEEFESLPPDRRVEMVDGVFHDMASPSTAHQWITTKIISKIVEHIEYKGMPCAAFAAPYDVQLYKDAPTILEPDLLVVCDREKVTKKRVVGAPDWVVEIISQSSRTRDYLTKPQLYMNAGVKELWLIDPDVRFVTVILQGTEDPYPPEEGDEAVTVEVEQIGSEKRAIISYHSFDKPIPVRICDGFAIDLNAATKGMWG